MRYAISSVSDVTGVQETDYSSLGCQSIRFGDVLFYITSESHWNEVANAARESGLKLGLLPHETPRDRLHMVVQKGRLFQQAHPEVPVLLDKGRYLIIDLDPQSANDWDHGNCPCYSIRSIPQTGVAFASSDLKGRRIATVPWVKTLTDRITRPTFESSLNQLVAFPTRYSTSSHYAAAANLVRTQLTQLGFTTHLQPISVNGKHSSNVVADKLGHGPSPRGVVIVSAHLDSINISGGPTAIAPGADDDGSGSAGVLSVAAAFKDHAAMHDLRLILFGGEEEGLFGSQQYVESLSPDLRGRLLAVVHMDMIATLNTTHPTVLLEGSPLSQAVIDGLSDAASAYTRLIVQTSLHPFNSDHVSFLDANIPAVLTIEGTDDANHHIHSANDTLDHINFDLALEIVRMNVAFIANMIGRNP